MGVNGHDDTFIINDITLRIPPTAIKISKDSLNYQWQTLRTNTSQKTKSGHSTVTIEFTVPFVGWADIHTKLKPLIAELRYMPFCFVENQFLRENLFPQEIQNVGTTSDASTMVFAFRAASITARNDTPGTIWVNFQFAYFNYLPYTPYWQYKLDLFDDEDRFKSTTFPAQSNAWLQFIAPAVNKSTEFSARSGTALIKFLELRTAPTNSTQSLSQAKDIINTIAGNQKPFFDAFRKPPTKDTPDKVIMDAVRSAYPQFQSVDDLAAADILGPLLVNASPSSNPFSKRFKANGQFVDQADVKKVVDELDQRIDERALIEAGSKDDVFEAISGLDFQDNRGEGFAIFKKLRSLTLAANHGIIIESITIAVQNILATIPIIGHRYATFQHIGSIDATVILDMKVTSDDGMAKLAWLYDTANDNALNNRHIPQGLQTIDVDNDFLALFNLKEFITQDMETCTIEGSPGTYDVKLSLIESGLKKDSKLDDAPDKFRLEFASQDAAVTHEIIRILNNNIGVDTNSGRFTSKINSTRSTRFGDIVKKYVGDNLQKINDTVAAAIPKKGEFVSQAQAWNLTVAANQTILPNITSPSTGLSFLTNEVADAIFSSKLVPDTSSPNGDAIPLSATQPGDLNLFKSLMALTEDDVPGITKVQEAIQARAKKQNTLNKDVSSLANQPLSQVLLQARNTQAKGAQAEQLRRQKAIFQRVNFDTTVDQNLSLGFTDEAPVTPDSIAIDTALDNTTESLLKLQAFTAWNEFLSGFATAIIESDDIELAEFASAKKLIKSLGLGRGLPAYPDFDLQTILPKEDQTDVDKLLALDPDCFLATPLNISLNSFVDPALVANAKKIALTSSQSAVNQIDKFYNDSWLPSFISDYVRDKIKKNVAETIKQNGTDGATSAGPPNKTEQYYSGAVAAGKFTNSAANTDTIMLGQQVIDSDQIHATKLQTGVLTAARTLNHSLNPADLFAMTQPSNGAVQPITDNPSHQSSKTKPSLGKQITRSTQAPDGSIDQSPIALASTAGTDLDTYALARMIASEDDSGGKPAYLAAYAWAGKNYGLAHGGIANVLLRNKHYGNGKFGSQFGGYAATSKDPSEAHLAIAKQVVKNEIQDPTDGSWKFSATKNFEGSVRNQLKKAGQNPDLAPTLQQHLAKRVAEGAQIVHATDVDPNDVVFFKYPKAQGKGTRAYAYAPPIPTTPNTDQGFNSGQNVADLSIAAFQQSIKNGQAMRVVRAFPTFKLYFLQDNSSNRRRFGLDDFYSYNAVLDIMVVRSRKIPADLMEITLTNVSGVLSNRQFQGPRQTDGAEGIDLSGETLDKKGDAIARDPNGFLTKNSKQQNTLASMMLQPGVDVQLKLGYANDPNFLTDVFNGKIMEVEFSDSDDLVRVICQSHAIELVQDMKGMVEPKEKSGFFVSDARTDLLLESLMAEKEVVHFGRWIRSQAVDTDSNKNRYLLTDKFSLQPAPQDDNIFVPSQAKLKEMDPGFLFSGIKYSIYQTTIWDIFDEMTLRHPGWIKSPVPYKDKYGPRMTMFFGLPSQLYFAADPTQDERSEGAQLRNEVSDQNSKVQALKSSVGVLNPDLFNVVDKRTNKNSVLGNDIHLELKPDVIPAMRNFDEERLALAKKYQSIRPFRSYHLVTSKHHIISNNIRASAKNMHNTVSVQYGKSSFNKDTKSLVQDGTDVLTLGVDAAMPDEEVREVFVQYPNCQTEYMAKNYALGYLMKELRDVYRGELTVIGNPDIKPYDCVTIFDDYSDIMGTIEVEQVVHKFSQDTGFITEITPDLFVTANEWVNMTANDMMSLIMEGAASALNHGTPTTVEQAATSNTLKAGALVGFGLALGAAPLIAIVGAGTAIGGYFMMQKMVDFTSHGQPVVINPLIHRGKPFVAGLPTSKLNNLWSTNKGEWFKEAFDGLGLWYSDTTDKFTFAANQGSLLNLFSGNGVPPKF